MIVNSGKTLTLASAAGATAVAFICLGGCGLPSGGRACFAAICEDAALDEALSSDGTQFGDGTQSGNGTQSTSDAARSSDATDIPLLVYAQFILSGEEALTADRIAQIRSLGPTALEKLFALRKVVSDHDSQDVNSTAELSRLDNLIDQVGAQRYCTYSRLYWYTDWQEAVEASKMTGKPILSLRMLGKLTDELCCADSRVFRLALYANERVSRELRARFVLHWHMVRPLPRIIVDFGDGRKIESTLTGHSIHYVMDSAGNVLDALPGRYSPYQFQLWLQRVAQLHSASRSWPADEFTDKLAGFHQSRIWEINSEINDEAIPDDACLDANSEKLFRQLDPLNGNTEAAISTESDAALRAAVIALQRSLEIQSVRNESHLHLHLHHWFAARDDPVQHTRVDDWVYCRLFQLPLHDRWFGLLSTDVVSALAGNGVSENVDVPCVPGMPAITEGSFDARLKSLSDALLK